MTPDLAATRKQGLPLLLGLAAAVWVPAPWSAALAATIFAVWLRQVRPPRREWILLGLPLIMAVLLWGSTLVAEWRVVHRQGWLERRLASSYQALFADIESVAAAAAKSVEPSISSTDERLAAFEALSRLTQRGAALPPTVQLLDADGDAVAWSGPGLRHRLTASDLPSSGFGVIVGFGAISLVATVPLAATPRPWRAIAGYSFSANELPFGAPWPFAADDFRWTLWPEAEAAEAATTGSVMEIAVPGTKVVIVELVEGRDAEVMTRWRAFAGASAAFLVGGALLLLALFRGLVLFLVPQLKFHHEARYRRELMLLGLAAVVVPLGSLDLGMAASGTSFGGVLLAALIFLTPRRRPLVHVLPVVVCPLLAAAAIGAFTLSANGMRLADLGSDLSWSVNVWWLLLAGWLPLFATLACPGTNERRGRELWAWLCAGLSLVAGALHSQPLLGVPLLIMAAVAGGVWAIDSRPTLGRVAAAATLASLLTAVAWETAYQLSLRRYLQTTVLAAYETPRGDELAALRQLMEDFLLDLDLSQLALGDPDWRHVRQDLPLELWQASPLSAEGVSSVVVVPSDGKPVSFSYGLPVSTATWDLDWQHLGEEPLALEWIETYLIAGQQPLLAEGKIWGEVRYWWVPAPGFRLSRQEPREVAFDLLQGYPKLSSALELTDGAWVELVGALGEPLLLGSTVDGEPRSHQAAYRWSRAADGGESNAPSTTVRIFLPTLGSLASLARVSVNTTRQVLLLLLAAAVVFVVGLARPVVRGTVWRGARSYTRRLMVVFALLLMVPLTLVNALLFQTLVRRATVEQESGGRAALEAAQRLLLDYLLSFEPGFSIDAVLDEDVFEWLPRVVQHEVNLYWRGSVYSSSNPDLFAAGLLPSRIPGEVYSRLSLIGESFVERINRTSQGVRYVEIYSPLRLPGETPQQGRLFLSVPLLAQQAEAARELDEIFTSVVVITTAVFVLLVAVGAVLARTLSTPLTQIVEGTGRIAKGETELGFTPQEPELAALATAIDDMAQRIAVGRQRVLLEKRVLEGVVDNITSGVVSFDRRRRVMMRNRVAADLLQMEIGAGPEQLTRSPHLVAVREFVAGDPSQFRRTTAKIPGNPEEEEREWNLVWVPVPGEGEPSALLVVEDVSDVLRSQRLMAWAEMARLIAHEVKNPLTPIRLSTEHLRQVHSTSPERLDEIFDRCIDNILKQVADLHETVSDFSIYSRILHADRKRGDLVDAVREVVDSYRVSPPPGVTVSFTSTSEELLATFDAKLLSRAVRNLLENAVRASQSAGEVGVSLSTDDGDALIVVLDRGPGVPAADLKRIFEPYFSTSSGGTGLGLPIAKRVVEEHEGSVVAENRDGGGLRVSIRIPL